MGRPYEAVAIGSVSDFPAEFLGSETSACGIGAWRTSHSYQIQEGTVRQRWTDFITAGVSEDLPWEPSADADSGAGGAAT